MSALPFFYRCSCPSDDPLACTEPFQPPCECECHAMTAREIQLVRDVQKSVNEIAAECSKQWVSDVQRKAINDAKAKIAELLRQKAGGEA